jgi:hypothetical protein
MARRPHLKLAASVWAFTFAFSPAAMAAVDTAKLTAAITEMMDGYGAKFQATSVEADGENVTLKGVTVGGPSGAGAAEPLGDITLNNVSETADGFVVGDISAPAKAYPVKDGTWDFGGASIKNLKIPAAGTTDPMKQMVTYESAEVAASSFKTTTGTEFISFAGLKASMNLADGNTLTFDMSAPQTKFDIAAIPENDPQVTQAFADLGLSNLEMEIVAKGSWNLSDGRLIISEETFNVKNAGKLNFTADFSGYTPQLMANLREMMKTAEGKSDAEMGSKMMGALQQMSLGSVSLRFDDASIVGKALDLASKRMGQPKEALIAQAKGMAPIMFMQLQDPEFSATATKALSDFLDNPKSLEIKLAPAAPVPVSQIVASGMAAPATLVKQLGLTVVANQ